MESNNANAVEQVRIYYGRENSRKISTLCPKKTSPTFSTDHENQLSNFNNFWHKYS